MIIVAPARVDQCAAALELLFAHHPEPQRSQSVREMLNARERGDIQLDGLLLAEEDGRSIGAALYVLQADKTAFVWPPVSANREVTQRVGDALYSELSRRADNAGAWLSQCLVAVDESTERAALDRNGYQHLADLSYMHRPLDAKCPELRGPSLRSATFEPANSERFAATIERTYLESHDCAALRGKRTVSEALASHKNVGRFDPLRWKVYEVNGYDVGVLLINHHAEQNAYEVVYVGVTPEARGNGYSRAMLIEGIRDARAAGGRSIFLAVDRRNMFARNVYDELCFREVEVMAVHVRLHPNRGALESPQRV